MSKSAASKPRSLKSQSAPLSRHAAVCTGSGATAVAQRATVAHCLSDVPSSRTALAAAPDAPAQLTKDSKKKPMDALSRLERARNRARNRGAKKAPLGKRRDVDTPFGRVGVSKGRGNQPYVTTRQKDFPGEKSIRGTYDSLQTVLKTPGLLADIASATKGNAGQGSSTSRAAATLFGIVTEAESAPTRFPGAGKIFRSVARRVKDAKTWKTAFGGDNPTFAMAARGGAQSYTKALSGEARLTPEQEKALEEMSDSSDDEA